MKLKLFTICDNAFTDRDGRLSIIQTFDQIRIQKQGASHPRLTIVSTYRVEDEKSVEDFNKTYEVSIIDPSEKSIASINIKKEKLAVDEKEINFIGYFINLPFNEGNYKIKIRFADTEEYEYPLQVKLMPAPTATQNDQN